MRGIIFFFVFFFNNNNIIIIIIIILTGSSDPYCVIELGKERFATRSIPTCLSPEWNEQCVLKTLLDR